MVTTRLATMTQDGERRNGVPQGEVQDGRENGTGTGNGARTPVLLIGTFPFGAPGGSEEPGEPKSRAVDMKTPERQAELDALVERFAAFRPTKVVVQAPYTMEGQLAVQYARYRFGAYQLGQNEVHQVGFRLARRLNHDRVYGIDVLHRWWEPGIEEAAKANPVAGGVWERIRARLDENRRDAADLDGRTIAEALAELNRTEPGRSGLEDYLTEWVRLVDGDNYAGADLVANWYQRNLRIYASLMRLVQPGDRLLVWYGSSHVPVLRHLLTASGRFALVDPLPYLEADQG